MNTPSWEQKGKMAEFLRRCDFEGMARAYREQEIAWGANEWKEFIERIREGYIPRQKVREVVEGMKMKTGWMPLGYSKDPYNQALTDVLTALLDEEV